MTNQKPLRQPFGLRECYFRTMEPPKQESCWAPGTAQKQDGGSSVELHVRFIGREGGIRSQKSSSP